MQRRPEAYVHVKFHRNHTSALLEKKHANRKTSLDKKIKTLVLQKNIWRSTVKMTSSSASRATLKGSSQLPNNQPAMHALQLHNIRAPVHLHDSSLTQKEELCMTHALWSY